jgi:hypothetical protein
MEEERHGERESTVSLREGSHVGDSTGSAELKGTMNNPGASTQEGSMIPLLTRHAVEVLLEAVHTQADIAKKLGAEKQSIARIGEESAIEQVNDCAERDR